MFTKFIYFVDGLFKIKKSEINSKKDSYKERMEIYKGELGDPSLIYEDNNSEYRIDIIAFERDFSTDENSSDDGFVLVTSGMSERRMHLPSDARNDSEIRARAELLWYVRNPTADIIANMRWLARLPDLDKTWFSLGHRIPMPTPPIDGCAFKVFLLMIPIVAPDERIYEALANNGEGVKLLTIHLISDAEYDYIKKNGIDQFLDILDEKKYPLIFDPKRVSYL